MYNKTKHKDKCHFGMKCLQWLNSEKILTNHKRLCLEINGKQSINETRNVQFSRYHKQLSPPFIIYADFESNLKKVQKPNRYNVDASYNDKFQKHSRVKM